MQIEPLLPLPLAPGMHLARLTPAQCQQLHAASVHILECTGVRLFEPEAVELARHGGALVSDGNRVRFPPRLVEQALASAPKGFTLYDRHGQPAMPLDGARAFFGPGSDCLHVIDHRSGERRRAMLQDVIDGVTVCDALPEIDFVMSMFLPGDVPAAAADRYQMAAMLRHTRKPIVYVTYDLGGCVEAVAMAEAVAGGAEALRVRPWAACYINVTTGLLHNAEALQKLLFLAEKGLPSLYIPVVSGGTTGPMTVAGGVALSNAGALVGVVLAQLKREGAPIGIPGFGGDALDMRTLVDPYCGPEPRGMVESLAHYYHLPMFALGGATEAKVVDQQAAAEAALMLMAAALSGGQIVHDLGYLESGLTGSLAQLAICAEIVAWIRRFTQAPVVDDETLALDLIDQVGPDGQYLAERHTRKHTRERWYPRLFERMPYHSWVDAGAHTLAERAAALVDQLLANHKPEALPAEADEAVEGIVRRSEDDKVSG